MAVLGLVCAFALAAPANAADAAPKLRHGYVDMRYGQLHFSIAQPAVPSTKTPIVFFHQSPNTSLEYDAIIAELGKDRVAIAIDTPGHGGSDGPDTQPTIEDYAAAVAEGLAHMGYGATRQIAIFGNHTGSRIGTELALTHPEMVRKVMLGLSPYAMIDDALSAKLLAETHNPESGDAMLKTFCLGLDKRMAANDVTAMADPVWVKISLDSLRATTRREFGHKAAYEYGPRFKTRLPQLTQPVLLLVIDDPADAGIYQSGKTALDMSKTLKAEMTKSKDVEIFDAGFHNDAFFGRTKDVADGFRAFVDKN
jgi:pimeloyl-ACP methyl ester carboxylesterase